MSACVGVCGAGDDDGGCSMVMLGTSIDESAGAGSSAAGGSVYQCVLRVYMFIMCVCV